MAGFESHVKDAVSRADQNPIGLFNEAVPVDSNEETSVTAVPNQMLFVDAEDNPVTVTLPEPTANTSVVVKKLDSTGNAVTIETPVGTQTIDGSASDRTITGENVSREIASDGSNYFII